MVKRTHEQQSRSPRTVPPRPSGEGDSTQKLPAFGSFRVVPGPAPRSEARAGGPSIKEALLDALQFDPEDGNESHASTGIIVDALEASLKGLTLSDQVTFIARFADCLRSAAAPGKAQSGQKSLPLPRKAPLLWSKRDRALKLSPVQFTRMTYGPWLGAGLTRSHLRELDKALYHALANWISRHPDDAMPELPSQSEQLDQKLERLAAEFSPDELRRLGLALQARMQRYGK